MRANTQVSGFIYNPAGTGMQFGEAKLPWHLWQKKISETMEDGGRKGRIGTDLLVHDKRGTMLFEVYDND